MRLLGFFICIAASAADQPFAVILKKRCLPCHNEELKNGGLSFVDRESALRGGGRGPAIVPGKPEASLMIATLSHTGDLQMPPGPPLPAKEVRILKEWIARGAKWKQP